MRYFGLAVIGAIVFAVTLVGVLYRLETSQYYNSDAKHAYKHHIILHAQHSLERLVFRLELAILDNSTVRESEDRPTLLAQAGMTWLRFADLTPGHSRNQFLLFPKLQPLVTEIMTTLDELEQALQHSTPDYAGQLQKLQALNIVFARRYTNLPLRLLPVQEARRQHIHRQNTWYYLAIALSSLLLISTYMLLLRSRCPCASDAKEGKHHD